MEVNVSVKKSIKKACNWLAVGLILYTIINYVVIVVDLIIKMVGIFIQTPNEAEQNRLLDAMFLEYGESGTSMIVGVLIGILFLWIWFHKRVPTKQMFYSNKKMTVGAFLQFICVFMGAQFLFSYVFELMEIGLNLLGYTAIGSMEIATSTSTTISMFLYASLIGPIVEELIYRGYVLRSVEKYGKVLAIVVSSVLFGIMHVNLPQDVFAFGVGLIFAYVAIEYSIVWSIVIHIFNNCVLVDLLSMGLANFSEQTQILVNNVLFGASFIGTIVILWKHRKDIRQYITDNKAEKKKYLYVFTSVAIIIFVVIELLTAISMVEPI